MLTVGQVRVDPAMKEVNDVSIIRQPRGRHIRRVRTCAGWTMAVLLGFTLAGCASRPAMDVALVGLAPVESTLFEQRLRLDFRLQNFSDRVLRATGLEVTLYVNGLPLARGVDAGAFEVGRLGETRASAIVSTTLFDVARQLLALPDRQTFSYELAGRVYLDGWPRSMAFRRGGEISRGDLERLSGSGGRDPAPLRLE
jgi:LEA14-like dessication related protein